MKNNKDFFYIFEANKVNSLTIPRSSSIILLKLGGFFNSSINFVLMVIAK